MEVSPLTAKIAKAILQEPTLSYEQIGRCFGVSRQRVGRVAKIFSISRKNYKPVKIRCQHCGKMTLLDVNVNEK